MTLLKILLNVAGDLERLPRDFAGELTLTPKLIRISICHDGPEGPRRVVRYFDPLTLEALRISPRKMLSGEIKEMCLSLIRPGAA